MKWIRVKVPEELHQQLKIKAVKENVPLEKLILRILENAVGEEQSF